MGSSGNDEPPGRGLRSLQIWRRLAEARRTLDQEQAAGREVTVEDLLRTHGIDESFLPVLEAHVDAPVELPPVGTSPTEDDDETPAASDELVVRSKGGRISLKVL